MSSSVLTEKERARLTKVRALLAAGENPYTTERLKEEGLNLSGSLHEPTRRVVRPQTRTARRKLVARWKKGQEGRVRPGLKFNLKDAAGNPYPNSPFSQSPISEVSPLDPGQVRCSFCGVPTPLCTATIGSKLGKSVEILVYEDDHGVRSFEEKVTHFSRRSVACPDCCLRIKPTVNRDGSLTSNQVWPTTD